MQRRPVTSSAAFGWSIALAVIGLFSLAAPVMTGVCWLAAAGLMGLHVYRKRSVVATQALSSSYQAISAGQFTAAEIELDEAERRMPVAWVKRIVSIQRSVIALRRGNLEAALEGLDRALSAPEGRTELENSRYQIEGAHAMRAFVCASLGKREEAQREIEYIRNSERPSMEALAKVSLAEAMMLEKMGERDRLRELLERDKDLLLENTHPRERAIIRAFQRMLKVSNTSVYRYSAPREEDTTHGEEPPLADWVAKIAPTAAAFVRVAKKSSAGMAGEDAADRAQAATFAGREAVRAARVPTGKRTSGLLVAGGVIAAIAAFIGIFPLLGGAIALIDKLTSTPATGMSGSDITTTLVIALVGLGLVSFLPAGLGIRALLSARAKKQAKEDLSRVRPGDPRELARFATADDPLVAAQAMQMAAIAHERAGEFREVVDATGWAVRRLLGDMKRAMSAGLMWSELVSLRAFALATLGREDEANAELESLPPAYPHRGRAVFRVRLVSLARRRDYARAAEWVESHALDLPLSTREELLADLCRAVAAPEHAGLGEIERLKEELRSSPAQRKWIDVAAPGLLQVFESGGLAEAPELQIPVQAQAQRFPVPPQQTAQANAFGPPPYASFGPPIYAAPSFTPMTTEALEAQAEQEAAEAVAALDPKRQRL